MDWRSVRFDWNRARAFLVTAEEGSLSAAARALGLAQPTLGRQVSAFEAEIGVVLFERGQGGLLLTPAGRDLLAHMRRMGEAASRVSLAATGLSQSLEGRVRITASEGYSAHLLAPVVARLSRANPGLTLEIVATNDLSDLRRREADIALRNARPDDPDLIARKITDEDGNLYASERYMAEHGPFPDAAALAKARFVGFGDDSGFAAGLAHHGLDVPRENFTTGSSNHLVHWELVRAGAGIGAMASWIADPQPGIVLAAPWFKGFSFPVWLVAHRELLTSRRMRLVYDRLAEEVTAGTADAARR